MLTNCTPPPASCAQYRNVNVKVLKHATYLRLMALKDLMWPAPAVLEVGRLLGGVDSMLSMAGGA